MTIAIARVHPVHVMKHTERWVTVSPQTKPTDLGCESADKWLLPIHIHHRHLLLLLSPKADTHFTGGRGWKVELT